MYYLIALTSLLMCSCVVDSLPPSLRSIDTYSVFDSDNISQTESEVSGTGRLLMDSSFRTTLVNSHFTLGGQFLNTDSFVVLHLFFDNFVQDTGIQLKISKGESDSIHVEYAEPTYPFRTLATLPNAIAQDGSFKIRVETRNQLNNDRRILMWNDIVFYSSEVRTTKDFIFSGNAEYDSRRDRGLFYTWGSGIKWGATLNKIKITELKQEAPYVRP